MPLNHNKDKDKHVLCEKKNLKRVGRLFIDLSSEHWFAYFQKTT